MSKSRIIFIYADVANRALWQAIDKSDQAKFDVHVVMLNTGEDPQAEFKKQAKLTHREYNTLFYETKREAMVAKSPKGLCDLAGSECKPNQDLCVVYPGIRKDLIVTETKITDLPVIIYEDDCDNLARLAVFISPEASFKPYYRSPIVHATFTTSHLYQSSHAVQSDVTASTYEIGEENIDAETIDDETIENSNCLTKCWATISRCWSSSNKAKYTSISSADEHNDKKELSFVL